MNKPIYHMTHIDNLQNILSSGFLLCKNKLKNVKYTDVAIQNIQDKRANRIVPKIPYGNLHDYVPFYFSTCTPMLYKLYKSGMQENMIFFMTDTNNVSQAQLQYVFSDRHAIIQYAEFYNDINELHKLDWNSISEKVWGYVPDTTKNKEEKEAELPDIREKKHAEFLVYQKIVYKKRVKS